MPRLNPVGDLVLTDPQSMRALADPVRLALVDQLRREGPATAAELASRLPPTRSALDDHLLELERFGIVASGDTVPGSGDIRWKAVGKGLFFEIPDDPEGQSAARELSTTMLLHYADLPRRWAADDEPRLELDWARAAGLLNAKVTVTAEEARRIQEELERLLEPFITRKADDVPAGAAPVRIISYFLPEARSER